MPRSRSEERRRLDELDRRERELDRLDALLRSRERDLPPLPPDLLGGRDPFGGLPPLGDPLDRLAFERLDREFGFGRGLDPLGLPPDPRFDPLGLPPDPRFDPRFDPYPPRDPRDLPPLDPYGRDLPPLDPRDLPPLDPYGDRDRGLGRYDDLPPRALPASPHGGDGAPKASDIYRSYLPADDGPTQ